MKRSSPIFLIVAVILAICCCGTLILGGVYCSVSTLEKSFPTMSALLTVTSINPTPTPFLITRQASNQIPIETMKSLEQTIIPSNNLTELACRFKGVCNIAPTLPPPAEPLVVGTQQFFWVNDEDTNSYFQVHATLRYITPHSYFWVADNVNYNLQEVKNLMDAFENIIYPTDRAFFGSEWSPGVDDDPHIYMLYTRGLGTHVGGYFYSPDEYPPQIFQFSNGHEMFYVSSSESLSSSYTYGTLAHEFQHMIHWYQHPDDSTFVNEGLSELAQFINHYDVGMIDQIYMANPDINLTDWLGASADNSAHYGASFLFLTYFLDRFGERITKDLVHDQKNGLDGMDDTLAKDNIVDPSIGNIITADNFFQDWTITNFIQNGSVGDGRFVYHNYPAAPKAEPTETVDSCPLDTASRKVNQYGVDYIRITCPGTYTLHFEGATSTRLLPVDPHSGKYAFWSNKGDLSDMTLTHEFDLTGISGSINMNYWTWYDIEKDFDYVYVEASLDGQNWNNLKTPSGTDSNPNGVSYGWAYTGQSGNWIDETVDLSLYAGHKVYVRFEYVTDPAVNGEGFLLDDFAIPAIHYSTDFETEDSSWQPAGFARIENTVPQTFQLAIITHTGQTMSVQKVRLTDNQSATIPLIIGQNGVQDVVLVIAGITRYTRIVAPYQLSIH